MNALLSVYTQADLKAFAKGLMEPEEEKEIRALLRHDETARAWVNFYRIQNGDDTMTEKLTTTEARQATDNEIARRVLLASMLIIAAIAITVLSFGPEAFTWIASA